MSKILLVKPRFFDLEFQLIKHPMGLMYIGAMLKRAGHEPKIHDCYNDKSELHALRQTITNWKPDFIGISIIVTELEHTKKHGANTRNPAGCTCYLRRALAIGQPRRSNN